MKLIQFALMVGSIAALVACGGDAGSNQAEIKPISYPKNVAIISPVTY